MIRRHNRREIVAGIGCGLASAFGYGCAYLFFRHVPEYVLHCFGIRLAPATCVVATFVILILVTLSGYRTWKQSGGFSSYHQSGLYHELDLSSGGAVAVDSYAHRVTGTAYLLSQLFLAGPLMGLRAISRFRNRITPDDALEKALGQTLSMLKGINKWQSLTDHPGLEREILLLARMGEIDFSSARGPRFKASSDVPGE
jgi:hypothetical protein